jgi:predicted RNA-binding Zn-ribbon protein involved in translation (DUF1610 family)
LEGLGLCGIWRVNPVKKIDAIQTIGHKVYCPNCGSDHISREQRTCFGTPGYIVEATCRECKTKF